MRIIKPQQLGILNRPFEYQDACFLGISIIAAIRLSDCHTLLPETEMWQQAMPLIGEQPLDLGMPKRTAEFLVSGKAYAPDGAAVTSMRAGVQLGTLAKELWVFGDRYMEGEQISAPSPFLSMPLSWAHAFGGAGFDANPLGKGFQSTENALGEKRLWLPNLEDPAQLYRLKGQRPDPANFGPVDIAWPQRLKLAGTYGSDYLKTAFPGFAKDIQWEYFNLGSRNQWAKEAFSGHETFRLYGLHPLHSVIDGVLPNLRARCFVLREDASELEECAARLTTVWFMPDIDQMILIYHGSLRIREDDARDIKSLMIAAEHADRPRGLEHYRQTFDKRTDPEGSLTELIKDEPLVPEGMARSLLQPFLDDYAKPRQSPLARNLDESMALAVEDLRARTAELGQEFPEEMVPKPSPVELPAFDDLDDFIEEKFRELDQAVENAKAERPKASARLREGLAGLEGYGPSPESMEKAIQDAEGEAEHRGPPPFSAARQREQVRQQLKKFEAIGVDTSEMAADLDSEEKFQQWCDAELKLGNLYRLGAHFQPPIGPSPESEKLCIRLFEMLDAEKDLAGHDYSGIDLSNANLRNRNLSGIFMESAILDGADFSGAVLNNAVLAHAQMTGTVLDGASLKDANLGKAQLRGVSARKARFEESILQGALLENCDFSDARMKGMQAFLEVELSGCKFCGAEIEDLFVNESAISGVDFSGATLIDPVFVKADLDGVEFSNAKMEESVFVSCSAVAASFAGARLAGSSFVDGCCLADCDFSGASLPRANLRVSILHRSCFDGADLNEADLSESEAGGASFRSISAKQSRWVRSDLRESDLRGAVLIGAVMHKADIRGALLGANLYMADLARVHVERSTDFDGALTAKLNTYPRKYPAGRSSDG